jgi:acetone carboxylase beta subunit
MDSVGSGAGSYIRLDPYTRAIKLGPDSAGYRVGVCWAESGIETVTISDCHVILGYLNPDNFLGGQVKLDRERAWNAMKEQIADPLGLSVEEAAAGVIELLDSELRDYLRSMISGKGYSPGSFTCFSYGGAGPVHTYGYTEGLGFEDVIVPAWAAGFSAFGCAAADFEYRYDKSLDINLPEDAAADQKTAQVASLDEAWQELAQRVLEEFALNGYSADQVVLQPGFRMQYRGQLNDLEIDSPIGSATTAEDWDALVGAFNDTYGRVYAASARSPELGYSVTGAIMRGTVPIPKPKIPFEAEGSETPPESAKLGTRKFYRHGKWVDAQLYQMETLRPGNRIKGPAIIESDATTFVVPGGFETRLDGHRLFHLKEI